MINANELRLGNWLWYKSDMYSDRPNKIHKNWFQVKYIGETIGLDIGFEATQRFEKNPIWSPEIKDLKPIRLKQEILEGCGFLNDENYYGIFSHPHLKCRWVTNKFFNGDKLTIPFLRFDSTGRPPFIKTDIYYLHQLQNIYFALVQAELKIILVSALETQ